ncbi:MerR family transcriptional regulator [Niallia circulans]|uniref:MerR family transcriptional regulator n=1 Tax=Niallia circulans TaxID=1397 RepID=UPI000BA652F2|nr:MerR family transcriptional regulator [Niallia circulans]PAD25861.1 MerR family transcriptional regulator [Niallia circulans]
MKYIDEIAKTRNLTESTLRYYEKEKIIPRAPRDKNGHRIYTDEIVEWVDFIISLKETGMPLKKIRSYAELYNHGDETLKERKEMMLQHKKSVKEHINKTVEHLEKINYKIALYDVQLEEVKRMP